MTTMLRVARHPLIDTLTCSSARVLAPFALALALGVTGCGDDEPDGPAGPDTSDAGMVMADAAPMEDTVAMGRAVMIRSCATCHNPGSGGFSVVGMNADQVDEDAIFTMSDVILTRLRSEENPMPPARAMGALAITPMERGHVISYVESIAAR